MKKNCFIIVLIFVNIYLIFQEKSLRDSLKNYFVQDQSEEQVQNEQAQNVCKEQLETLYEDVSVSPERLAGQGYIENVEVEETEFKDIDGDGEEDIRMIIDVEVSEISGEKKNETYTMNFMQEKDKYNELKMFRGVLADTAKRWSSQEKRRL